MPFAHHWKIDTIEEDSFWPTFTDIMMVITMIFLLVSVVVIIANNQLVADLKKSLTAELLAKQQAQELESEARKAHLLAEEEFRQKKTLAEQIEELEAILQARELDLLQVRSQLEVAQLDAVNKLSTISQLQLLSKEQADAITSQSEKLTLQSEEINVKSALILSQQQDITSLKSQQTQKEQQLQQLQSQSQELQTTLSKLREEVVQGNQQLLSLKGEFTELDSKYQKLLRPARSSGGKAVVEVVYSRSGFQIRNPQEANRRNVSQSQLEKELDELKIKHGNNLYVRIIIPNNSGLSYNQAWDFTRSTLNKYDYYYQE